MPVWAPHNRLRDVTPEGGRKLGCRADWNALPPRGCALGSKSPPIIVCKRIASLAVERAASAAAACAEAVAAAAAARGSASSSRGSVALRGYGYAGLRFGRGGGMLMAARRG